MFGRGEPIHVGFQLLVDVFQAGWNCGSQNGTHQRWRSGQLASVECFVLWALARSMVPRQCIGCYSTAAAPGSRPLASHTRHYTETETVRLIGPMVRVLSENDDTHVLDSAGAGEREDISGCNRMARGGGKSVGES